MPQTSRAVLVILILAAAARVARADDAHGLAPCTMLPPNIDVPGPSREAVRRLLDESPTLQRQCAAIAAATPVHVTIRAVPTARLDCRARSELAWSASGHLDVIVEVPIGRDFPELVAHELEHVLEQIEGVDLAALARRRDSGVVRRADGSYETRRAHLAGLLAAMEVDAVSRRP